MTAQNFTAQFGSMSSSRIQQGLDKGLWDGDKKEAAIFILKRRNIDVSKYIIEVEGKSQEDIEVEVVYIDNSLEKISSKTIKEVNTAIDKVSSSGNQELASKLLEILGETQTENLSPEQAEKILELAQPAKKIVLSTNKSKIPTKTKRIVELSAEKKEKATEVLSKQSPKKEKIIELADAGFSRTEILSLNFVDPTYVYDLVRELYPELCKK